MASPSNPLIYAHRGASFDHPEMSREAYVAAVSQGADGFECDLRRTQDGVLVCWHDPNMKRVANRNLVIANSSFAELRAAYPIITLEELLEIALENRKSLALETKHPVLSRGAVERELLQILDRYRTRISDTGIEVSIMSFSWLANARIRNSGWNSVFLVSYRWLYALNIGRSLGPSVEIIKHLKNSRIGGKKIFVWTANTEEEILLCKAKGIDVMMTDRPAYARVILERR